MKGKLMVEELSVTARFQRDLAEVCWRELRVHMRRDALVTVSAELDLVEVAVAVAEDNTRRVDAWIGAGQLGKPGPAELGAWERSLDKEFRMLIVQPFILIQEV